MLERSRRVGPSSKNRWQEDRQRSPSASGSEDVERTAASRYVAPVGPGQTDADGDEDVERKVRSTKSAPHRLDNGSFIDAMFSRLLGKNSLPRLRTAKTCGTPRDH